MISAPIAKAINFPSQRQVGSRVTEPRPACPGAWLARISQRLQRRQHADGVCLIH